MIPRCRVECVSVIHASFADSEHVLEAMPGCIWVWVRGGPIEGQTLKDGCDYPASGPESDKRSLITYFQ